MCRFLIESFWLYVWSRLAVTFGHLSTPCSIVNGWLPRQSGHGPDPGFGPFFCVAFGFGATLSRSLWLLLGGEGLSLRNSWTNSSAALRCQDGESLRVRRESWTRVSRIGDLARVRCVGGGFPLALAGGAVFSNRCRSVTQSRQMRNKRIILKIEFEDVDSNHG